MIIPDVIALSLGKAQEQLANSGYDVKVIYTAPPGKNVGVGEVKVIRQRVIGENTIELIAAFTDYQRE